MSEKRNSAAPRPNVRYDRASDTPGRRGATLITPEMRAKRTSEVKLRRPTYRDIEGDAYTKRPEKKPERRKANIRRKGGILGRVIAIALAVAAFFFLLMLVLGLTQAHRHMLPTILPEAVEEVETAEAPA